MGQRPLRKEPRNAKPAFHFGHGMSTHSSSPETATITGHSWILKNAQAKQWNHRGGVKGMPSVYLDWQKKTLISKIQHSAVRGQTGLSLDLAKEKDCVATLI